MLEHTSGMPARTPDRLEPFRKIARKIPGAMAVGRWLHVRLDPQLRSISDARKTHQGKLFQPFPTTFEDRYPVLFDALANRLAAIPQPRILSFGCASGEEVRALRQRIPGARITGIDANRRAIAKARSADTSPLSEYRHASSIAPIERFDAILALAVFRHGALEAERPDTCSGVLPFARFEEGIAMLDGCLAPGGYLAVWNAHFRFCDTATAQCYAIEALRASPVPRQLLYGPNDDRLDGASYDEMLFRKR